MNPSILAAEQSGTGIDTTPAATMQHSADMAPSRASCNPAQGVGRCEVTGAGPPSAEHGDYRACYPLAERYCDAHKMRTDA